MSQFDFVSVFFSIVFGLGLSQLLIGLMNDVSRRKVTEQQWVYSAFALSNVILNWWVVFKWRTVEEWPYEVFFLLVVWAIALFGMTIALYPPGEKDVLPFEQRKRMLLWAWLVFLVLDTVQIAAQGGLSRPGTCCLSFCTMRCWRVLRCTFGIPHSSAWRRGIF